MEKTQAEIAWLDWQAFKKPWKTGLIQIKTGEGLKTVEGLTARDLMVVTIHKEQRMENLGSIRTRTITVYAISCFGLKVGQAYTIGDAKIIGQHLNNVISGSTFSLTFRIIFHNTFNPKLETVSKV